VGCGGGRFGGVQPEEGAAALPHRARQHSRTEPARDPRRGEIQGGGGGGRCLCGRGGGARRGLAGCFHARAWEGAGSGGGNQWTLTLLS
jgi:hypothetical protein